MSERGKKINAGMTKDTGNAAPQASRYFLRFADGFYHKMLNLWREIPLCVLYLKNFQYILFSDFSSL
jgi:hypothetical protein